MHVTAPVHVGQTGIEVSEHNVVPFVANEAYALFVHTNEERKLVLGRVAQAVVHGFLEQQGQDVPRLRALLNACSNGHVKAWSAGSVHGGGSRTDQRGRRLRPIRNRRHLGRDEQCVGHEAGLLPATNRHLRHPARSRRHGNRCAPSRHAERFPHVWVSEVRHRSVQALLHVNRARTWPWSTSIATWGACLGGDAQPPSRRARSALPEEGYPFFEDYVRTPSGDTATIDGGSPAHPCVGRRRDEAAPTR